MPVTPTAVVLSALLAAVPVTATPELRFEPHTIQTRDGSTINAEVASLEVPARRAVPGSPKFTLALMRLPSTSPASGNPVVFLAGGPGNASLAQATSPAVRLLRSVGDVILFDQRGTGRSTPRPICRGAEPPPPAHVYSDEAKTTAGAVALVRDCAAKWKADGVDPGSFTTEESADDVEALRQALGAPKIDLVGFSYGTHLAFSVLRRHGAHVGRAVFIATEGPADTWKYPETLDLHVQRLSYLATGSEALVRSLDRVKRKLDAQPVTVPVRTGDEGPVVGVRVSGFGLERILVQDLSDSSDFVVFPAMLEMLERGDTSLLARYVEKRYRAMTTGLPLMSVATDCASGASQERLAEIRRQAAGSRFPHLNFPYPDVCAGAGAPDLGEAFRQPLLTSVPALFVSGTLDYQTPPYQAERARWGFLDARHIVVVNGGHEDLDTNREVGTAVAAFLRGQAVLDGTIHLPAPRFLTVEEVRATRKSAP